MKKLLIIILTLLSLFSFGQDPQFSQYYAAPLLLNPALAGAIDCYRVGTNARSQWTGLPGGAFNTAAAYIDMNVPDYRSGVGLMVLHDEIGSPKLTSNEVSGFYSFLAPVNKQLNFRFGLQGTYVSRSLDYSRLIFEDQFSGTTVTQPSTSDPVSGFSRVNYGDISAGTMVYGEKTYWLGFSASHLTQPKQAFYLTGSRLPIKYTVHGGYNFHYSATKSYKEADWLWIIPTFLYKAQGKFDQLDLGVYLIKNSIMFGMWYRGIFFKQDNQIKNSDALSFHLGYQYQRLSFVYSYDVTTSKLALQNTKGSHEISLIYLFCADWPKRKKVRPMHRLPCPDFQRSMYNSPNQ